MDFIVCPIGIHSHEDSVKMEKIVKMCVAEFPGMKKRLKFEEFKNANLEKVIKVLEQRLEEQRLELEKLRR